MPRSPSRIPFLLFVAVLSVPASALALETELTKAPLPPLPDDYWPRLRSGEIVIMEREFDPDVKVYGSVVELGLIPAPPDAVFNIVDDCLRFPEFMPYIEKTEWLDAEGEPDRVLAQLWTFEADVFLGAYHYQIVTLSDRRNGVVTWTLNPHADNDILQTDGRWWLYPMDEGKSTLVVYHVTARTKAPVPDFVNQYLAESGVRDILAYTRNRVLSGGAWKKGDPAPNPSASIRVDSPASIE